MPKKARGKPLPKIVYLIDTCVWVSFDDDHKLADVLAQLQPHVESGAVKTLGKVLDELKRRWKPLHKSVKALNIKVTVGIEMHPKVVSLAGRLLLDHPRLGEALSAFNTADPWIIATAEVHGWVVVTDEGRKGKRIMRTMRGVCSKRGVTCLDRFEFAKKLGITL